MQFLKDKQNPARFNATALQKLTKAQLKELRQLFPGVTSSDPAVAKFQEQYDPLKKGMTPSEMELIGLQVAKMDSGVSVHGSPYEERMFPQGGQVDYSPSKVSLITKVNERVDLPNYPLAPAEPIIGKGKDRLVMILASFFDFEASKLRPIRDATLEARFFGHPNTNFNPLGVAVLQRAVHSILEKNDAWKATFTEKKTITGHEATDFWYSFVEALSKVDYHALHTVVIENMIRHVAMKPDSKTQLIRPHVQRERTPDGAMKDPKIPLTTFMTVKCDEYRSQGYEPVVVNRPINPVATMIRKVGAARELLALYKESVTLRGGNKRGVGMVAQYIDYCPRQSNVIRRLNWFVMAMSNIKAPCDVHADSGDLALLNAWITQTSQVSGNDWVRNVRILISLANTKGQERKSHYIESSRSSATQIVLMDWATYPEILSGDKHKEANDVSIEKAATSFKEILASYGKFFVMAPCYSPSQFSSQWNVFRFGKGHDLQAIYSNVAKVLNDPFGSQWCVPVDWDEIAETSRLGIRFMNCWMFCGEPIHNTLGQWYRPPEGTVSVENGEWSFSDSTPFLPTPTYGEYVDDDGALPFDGDRSSNSSLVAPYAGLRTDAPRLIDATAAVLANAPANTPAPGQPEFADDELPNEEEGGDEPN